MNTIIIVIKYYRWFRLIILSQIFYLGQLHQNTYYLFFVFKFILIEYCIICIYFVIDDDSINIVIIIIIIKKNSWYINS